jgi:ubiquinone biosynthesis protein UbiJ
MALGPDAFGAAAFNRALERAPWAREKLAAHAGRSFSAALGPLVAGFRILQDGRLEPASFAGVAPDLHLRVSPMTLSSFLADPSRWNEFVVEEGDVALGGALKELALTLPWLVEDAFARAFGAVIGQRMADAGRQLLALPGYAAERIADSVASYARDEADLLARGDEMRTFAGQNAALASRVTALEARMDALSAPRASPPGEAGARQGV